MSSSWNQKETNAWAKVELGYAEVISCPQSILQVPNDLQGTCPSKWPLQLLCSWSIQVQWSPPTLPFHPRPPSQCRHRDLRITHKEEHYGTENFRAVESQHRPDLQSKEIFFCQVGIIDKTAAFVTCPTHCLLVQHECCKSKTQRKAFHIVHKVGLLSSATSCNLQLKWRAAHNCSHSFPIQLKDFRIALVPGVG